MSAFWGAGIGSFTSAFSGVVGEVAAVAPASSRNMKTASSSPQRPAVANFFNMNRFLLYRSPNHCILPATRAANQPRPVNQQWHRYQHYQ